MICLYAESKQGKKPELIDTENRFVVPEVEMGEGVRRVGDVGVKVGRRSNCQL